MLKPAVARRLNDIRDELQEATQARDDAIVEAWRQGGGIREIAREVGMSHMGVSNLLQRAGVRRKWRNLEDANRELERRDAIERGDLKP